MERALLYMTLTNHGSLALMVFQLLRSLWVVKLVVE